MCLWYELLYYSIVLLSLWFNVLLFKIDLTHSMFSFLRLTLLSVDIFLTLYYLVWHSSIWNLSQFPMLDHLVSFAFSTISNSLYSCKPLQNSLFLDSSIFLDSSTFDIGEFIRECVSDATLKCLRYLNIGGHDKMTNFTRVCSSIHSTMWKYTWAKYSMLVFGVTELKGCVAPLYTLVFNIQTFRLDELTSSYC